jgi:Leucine rich repeat/WG containing repeat
MNAKGSLVIILLIIIASGSMEAQCFHIDQLMKEGDGKFRRGDYLGAINKYQAAITDCSDRSGDVQPKILRIFREIEMLRNEAEAAKDSLRQMLQKLEQSQLMLEKALRDTERERDAAFEERLRAFKAYNEMRAQQIKNQKLLNAFYFYDDSLAVACRDGKFGFVDKEGELKIPYKYEKANNFYFPGFAEIQRNSNLYFVDPRGDEYSLARSNSEIEVYTKAVMIQNGRLRYLPQKSYETVDLRVLMLDGNRIKWLPSDIGRFRQLEVLTALTPYFGKLQKLQELHLDHNQISSLPEEIGLLTEMRTLNIDSNQLTSLPNEIGDLKSLRRLELSHNIIQSLPFEINRLQTLEYLSLNANWLLEFPRIILKLQSLRTLHIGHNPCSDTPEKREAINAIMHQSLPNCRVLFD